MAPRSLWRGLHGHQPLKGAGEHSHFIQLAVDYTAPLPLNPICCDKVFSYRDKAEFCYQEQWLIHNPILKCRAFHLTAPDIAGRNSSEINTAAERLHRRRKGWPSKKIPLRLSKAGCISFCVSHLHGSPCCVLDLFRTC